MIEQTVKNSRFLLGSATIHLSGKITAIIVESIERIDGSYEPIRQVNIDIPYRDERPFTDPLLAPYQEAAKALWTMRDNLAQGLLGSKEFGLSNN